ncbi:Hsp20/alpha crystallin family protein [Flavobacteriaceae bacterium F08102]|nr:Hsp20/alpha crystallin family protein [Flavobacteriaceae bacterium F08102]
MMLVKKNDNIPVFPSLFSDFFDRWDSPVYIKTTRNVPAVNVKENDDAYVVEVAVPGMDKKDFKIDLNENILTISSEKEEQTEDKNDNYTRKEYSYSSFERRFTLPKDSIAEDDIEATYVNGELRINLPKREEVKPKALRAIEVK